MTIYYLPLEPYEERYTLQLRDWETNRFKQRGVDFVEVTGTRLDNSGRINTGVVLDAHGRSYYALTQTANLVELLGRTPTTNEDILYFTDMFHPGIEAIPYIFDQLPKENRPKIFVRCWAQSVDINDFTYKMRHWMRHYEHMVDYMAQDGGGIFVASEALKDLLRITMHNAPIYNVGLPFDIEEVRSRVTQPVPLWEHKKNRIAFTSRWDEEKQPWFYLKVIDALCDSAMFKDWEFAIFTSAKELRSNNPENIKEARQYEADGKLKIYEGLSKNEYYTLLSDTKIQFNCALQDFVSNTLLEASAFNTVSIVPAYLGFPEAVFNEARQMYVPWSEKDAADKIYRAVINPPLDVIARSSQYHDKTIDRIINVFEGLHPLKAAMQ